MLGKGELRDHKHISSLINGAINEIVKEYKKERPNHDIRNTSSNYLSTNNYCFKDNLKYIEFSCDDVVNRFALDISEEDANIEHIKWIVREIVKEKL